MDGQDAIAFVIIDKATGVCGYTWFIESHATSFYIKSTFRPMQMVKVSIHGPDADHPNEHYRLDFTKPKESGKAIRAGGGWGGFGQALPLAFEGRPVNKRTVHLVRFSAEWSMFRRGMQRGPDPEPTAKASIHGYVDAPSLGRVTHVDIFLSRVRPYWQNRETKLRKQDAGIGPLINDAGMYLTAVISQISASKEPDPFGDPSKGVPAEDCIRGIAEGVDYTGLLWICEKMIPKSKVEQVKPPPRDADV
ncbi:hypothetical protein [Mycobacterium sp. 236(2023)]|uniref:hypothetical protein n=1 Tax=Mycobacterium sp. 236(2023) TaxID=3038163 RepID=UPI0024154E08|nr:hypothetical protein [Mycobacterium sp. 236(2023)]MDG4667966.1 hypothetical protein [Mycobacterium sp. 236(2023)]